MVIDDLPAGSGPLERFQRDSLSMDNSTRSIIASRIVQSFGRISRGMSDHGVVVLTGEALVNWIRIPRNRSLLPNFLENQIRLGEEISKSAKTVEGLGAAVNGCLDRDSNWIATYSDYMKTELSLGGAKDSEIARDVALAEASFGELLWRREFAEAADVLSKIQSQAVEFSQHAGAWLTMWWGYAIEMAGDPEAARELYRRAYALNSNIPRMVFQQESPVAPAQQQILNVGQQMQVSASQRMRVRVPNRLEQDLLHLNGSGSAPQTEEALRCLGQYLGLESTRPDNEHGTGPDVLWLGEDGMALAMELKTDKEQSSSYRKADLGELRDHVQWVSDHYQVTEVVQIFVGPPLPVSQSANPSPEMLIIGLDQFDSVGKRLSSALQDVADNALPLKLIEELNDKMKTRGLLWPGVYESLEKVTLADK